MAYCSPGSKKHLYLLTSGQTYMRLAEYISGTATISDRPLSQTRVSTLELQPSYFIGKITCYTIQMSDLGQRRNPHAAAISSFPPTTRSSAWTFSLTSQCIASILHENTKYKIRTNARKEIKTLEGALFRSSRSTTWHGPAANAKQSCCLRPKDIQISDIKKKKRIP